ncbi:hypothetical protein ABAC460_18630 [Asticcacaulis sp. AC460]|uniref:hypothetical protein n=1 Tax=Asticcacaulis sp. AC460 TaxID=1282360 RepID=UPI0003C4009F|nr:hypothetical protein [Asticcacaulis sp. AC460]ESQ87690.1 hypothetical protein ABAC460_18630 [Asticcacaulis sp. AC460]
MFRPIALAAALCAFVVTPAMADCTVDDPKVKAYLSTLPGWHVITNADLYADDAALWKEHRGNACPGLARVDLQGEGRTSYGLVILSKDRMRMVVLVDAKSGFTEHILFDGPLDHMVVHTEAPGPAYEFETREKIQIPNQSLVFEKLEVGAVLYYWRNGKLEEIIVSG